MVMFDGNCWWIGHKCWYLARFSQITSFSQICCETDRHYSTISDSQIHLIIMKVTLSALAKHEATSPGLRPTSLRPYIFILLPQPPSPHNHIHYHSRRRRLHWQKKKITTMYHYYNSRCGAIKDVKFVTSTTALAALVWIFFLSRGGF